MEREHVDAILAQLVKRLSARDAAARERHAQALYAFVASLARQLSPEPFAKALAQLTPQLYALLQSASESDQLGGLAAIHLLVDLATEDQIIRFANYLRNFLAQPNASRAALLAASAALGRLASASSSTSTTSTGRSSNSSSPSTGVASNSGVSGTLVAAFVDFEVKRAFEWLQGERQDAVFSQRRLAACFVLRALARAAPTLFHVNLTTFFQSIWGAVRDPRVEIREAATDALSACLQLITARQTRHRVQWYCKVYDHAFEGLRPATARLANASGGAFSTSSSSLSASSTGPSSSSTPATLSWECIHGSLLVVGELLQHTGRFMVPRFREVCDTVLLYKDAKDPLVARAVTALLPRLAAFCPDAFVQHYLDVAVAHLTKKIATYSARAERCLAFLAVGKLAVGIGDRIVPHLPPIVKLVREALPTHHQQQHGAQSNRKKNKARNKLFCVETLTCVANLSRALGSKFESYLFEEEQLLETMMIGGLTDELIDALAEVVASVPAALPYVQERLLNEISLILRGVPFSHGGTFFAYNESQSGARRTDRLGSSDLISEAPTSSFSNERQPPAAPVRQQSAVQALLSSMKRGSFAAFGGSSFSSATASVGAGTTDEENLSGSYSSYRGATASSSSPNTLMQPLPPPSHASLVLKGDTSEEIGTILLSLRTLSCFDFSGSFCLLPFVRNCVGLYLTNADPRIRKQAVVTCSKLLLPPRRSSPSFAMLSEFASAGSDRTLSLSSGSSSSSFASSSSYQLQPYGGSWEHVSKRGPSGKVIDQVLEQLLVVGSSDMDMAVRKSVVDSLDDRYDELMSQEVHLARVFVFLNDESAEIRECAMQLLERLAPRNPAFVMPSLRGVLIQLITELKHTSDLRMREESTRLLGLLIRGAQHLVDPYIVRILEVLLPTLVHGNPSLASAVLVTLGELAIVSQTQIGAYKQYLFPLIIHTLQDHSSVEKRQVALQTLGQLAGSTGCVIRPYLASPKLLEMLLGLLHHSTATPWALRREAMKTIGILGALDPYKYRLCVSRASLRQANETLGTSTKRDDGDRSGESRRKGATTDPTGSLANGVDSAAGGPYLKLNMDLKALGLNIDLANFDNEFAGEILDEKQQIELQLFTAAPIGTRRPDSKAGPGEEGSLGGAGASGLRDGTSSTGMSAASGPGSASAAASSLARRALDGHLDDSFDLESVLVESDLELDPTELSPSSESYFPTVAIHALLWILKEPSLSTHHHGVIQAVMFIFRSLSTQCVPFLKYIIPPFLRVLSRCEPRLRESLFLQLTNLISIVQAHMKPFFPPIMVLALRFWRFHLPQIVRLMEKVSQAAPHEFRTEYFPKLLPKLLEVLQPHPELFDLKTISISESVVGERSTGAGGGSAGVGAAANGALIMSKEGAGFSMPDAALARSRSEVSLLYNTSSGAISAADSMYLYGYDMGPDGIKKGPGASASGGVGGGAGVVSAFQVQVVQALIIFGDAVDDYVYLLIPALVRLMESLETPLDVKIVTIYCIARICVVANFDQYAGPRILQPLGRVVSQVSAKGLFSFGSNSSATSSAAATASAGVSGSSGGAAAIAASKADASRFSDVILYALAAMAYQMQADVLSFEPLLRKIISALPFHDTGTSERVQVISQALDSLRYGEMAPCSVLVDHPAFAMNSNVRKLAADIEAAAGVGSGNASVPGSSGAPAPSSAGMRLHVNQQNLRRAWEASQRSTKEDWIEWMRRFSIELLRESPSAALRSCCSLAQAYKPLARSLFNPAFVSCWNELYEQYQDYLVRALETAFQSDTIPAEILQMLLNLAEFMEHDVEALPIDIRELGELAQKCHAYAKALHYKELEFHTSPSTCIEALISINNQLGQPEAAVGILKYAQDHHASAIQVKETWFEKLQDWEAALALYNRRIEREEQAATSSTAQLELSIGKMRCLEALGRWEELGALANSVWQQLAAIRSTSTRRTPSSRFARLQHTDSSGSLGAASTSSGGGPPASGPGVRRMSSFPGISSGSSMPLSGPPSSGSLYQMPAEDREESARKRVAMLGARASWCLSQWDSMALYVSEYDDANNTSSSALASSSSLSASYAGASSSSSVLSFPAGATTAESATEIALYRAVLAVHSGRFDDATALIDETRHALDAKLGALVGESYSRAYDSMVTLQQLSELEEIVTYKKLRLQVAKTEEAARYKSHIVRMWHDRLSGCKRVVEVWQQLLAVRSLILSPYEDIETWLEYASLCRQSGKLELSLKVFTNSLSIQDTSNGAATMGTNGDKPMVGASAASMSFGFGEKDHSRVVFAYLKHQWAAGKKEKALVELQHLVSRISSYSRITGNGAFPYGSSGSGGYGASMGGVGAQAAAAMPVMASVGGVGSASRREEDALLVKCHLKLAEWQLAFHDQQLERVPIPSVLSSLRLCTDLEPRSYKAWHAWALMNFHVVEYYTRHKHSQSSMLTSGPGPSGMSTYIAPAIEGFFRSIALGRSRWAANVQQDILRVLTLWFAHGHRSDVHAALEKGFRAVSIETWLIVIPQLIARIHMPHQRIHTQLHRLLVAIGKQHPHALIYPLSVALKSSVADRQRAAEAIMATMRQNYVELVDEALLVSRELIRVAILWHELWHEGLEEASRLYFGEHNVDGMVEVLRPLHAMMENGPETLREVSFQQAFGRDLREAHEWLQRFLSSHRRNESDLNRAWDLYYHVFRRINKQLQQITSLELQYVSPNLLQARNLQLAVPGTYRAGHALVTIGRFLSTVMVIASKQRPRRIAIVGSNGLEYMFLLKGHEDLRQDERVTQLFGLVNALLINDRTTSKKDLKIHRYPVIPLSDNAGIVGWVPHCDTLHQLIRDYREARKILLNIEHRLMLQMAPDYDALTLLQKVEVFEYALENTAGQDLYKVLWLKSENSEVWLDRRTNYTRSLAVMSMVGYILGLGDRHPSNLMLHRFTGTIVHIDFGDCFEVAMNRDKYPEKIPFRLTRMLTNAMEVSGIEGNFRSSCESVMQVLRENRHSLMAMLEAFVHDPLICWRLLTPTASVASPSAAGSSVSSSVASSSMASSMASSTVSSAATSTAEDAGVAANVRASTRRSESISIPEPSRPDAHVRLDEDEVAPQPKRKEDNEEQKESTKEETDAVPASQGAEKEEDAAKSDHEEDQDDVAVAEGDSSDEASENGDENDAEEAENDAQEQQPKRLALPPLPSTSFRPTSLSQSIPFTRTVRPPPSRTGAAVDNDDEEEADKVVQKIDYSTTKLHMEMAAMAASVSSVGQSSLSRRFSVTAAEAAAAMTIGQDQPTAHPAPEHASTNANAPRKPPAAARPMPQAEGGAGGVVRAKARRASISQPPQQQASVAPGTSFVAVTGAAQLPPQAPPPPSSAAIPVNGNASASAANGMGDPPANRSVRERELLSVVGPEGAAIPREALNEKAVAVIRRVQAKLSGRDFEGQDGEPLDVSAQVQRLISQATSHENLCQCYIGWCPFW